MYLQYTPSSKRNLYSKIIDKSEAVYFFHVSMKHKFMNYKTPAKTKQIYII